MVNYNIKVKGNVHGVGYRYAAYQKANILGVKGTVQNLDDGTVLINATANPESMETFVKWCHVGPDAARVQEVEVQPLEQVVANEFRIIR